MASVQAMRTETPTLDGAAHAVLNGFLVAVAIAVVALMTALYVEYAGAAPGTGVDDASMYVLD